MVPQLNGFWPTGDPRNHLVPRLPEEIVIRLKMLRPFNGSSLALRCSRRPDPTRKIQSAVAASRRYLPDGSLANDGSTASALRILYARPATDGRSIARILLLDVNAILALEISSRCMKWPSSPLACVTFSRC